MLHILAHVNARTDAADAMRGVFEALVVPSRGEPGCIDYQVYEDVDRPGRFVTVECWRDQDAFDKHMASPHVAGALAAAGPLLAKPPSIQAHHRLA